MDVGDRANDGLRVNAEELRAKVFGEGGNLGMTQAARIEFALAGGRVNTDFIDNAGGVDCSDHEVNLKILFNQLVGSGDFTLEQRNRLLAEMTEDVADLVLTDSFRQAQALSIAQRHVRDRLTEYQRFMARMETDRRLDRALEGVPSDDVLADRATRGESLTRPELAVLLSYAKAHIKEHLIDSTIHTDAEIAQTVFEEFPPVIRAAVWRCGAETPTVSGDHGDDARQRRGASPRHFFGGAPVRFRWRGNRRDRACLLCGGAVFRNP